MATDFRPFVIGPDGHVINRIDLVCDSEDALHSEQEK
jgi:hypothetical protein